MFLCNKCQFCKVVLFCHDKQHWNQAGLGRVQQHYWPLQLVICCTTMVLQFFSFCRIYVTLCAIQTFSAVNCYSSHCSHYQGTFCANIEKTTRNSFSEMPYNPNSMLIYVESWMYGLMEENNIILH